MKKYILASILLSFTAYAQSQINQSIYELKHITSEEIKNGSSDASFSLNEDIPSGKKNTGLAILYSLLLPGMGELYAESYSSGMYFTIAESVLWGTYIGINAYGGWQEDKYKSFAVTKGGVNPENKDDEFYARIGTYDNIEQYNDLKALERNFDQMYNPQLFSWKWNSTEERREYRSLWLSSEQAYNNVRFVVGAMLINRLASAVNAVRLVVKYNNRLEEQSWNISIGTLSHQNLPTSLSLNFHTSF